MGTQTSTPPNSTLALLPIPPLDDLSEQQVRGTACVWDGKHLSPGNAVDLGPRIGRRAGQPFRWFPRACGLCVSTQALRAVYEHVDDCEPCRTSKEGTNCDTGRALIRLSLRGGR